MRPVGDDAHDARQHVLPLEKDQGWLYDGRSSGSLPGGSHLVPDRTRRTRHAARRELNGPQGVGRPPRRLVLYCAPAADGAYARVDAREPCPVQQEEEGRGGDDWVLTRVCKVSSIKCQAATVPS